jgi:putative membrane protein
VWLSLFGGTTGAYLLVGFVPVSTPNDPWFLFLSGAIAICAMILPGISGSFILVLLGKYMYVLEAVNNRDFLVLFLVASGACVGIVAFSRLLGWLLNNYHDLMVALLTGLMLGSLRKVWPWKETIESRIVGEKVIPIVQSNVLPEGFGGEVVSALCLMVMGLLAVLLLDRMGNSG